MVNEPSVFELLRSTVLCFKISFTTKVDKSDTYIWLHLEITTKHEDMVHGVFVADHGFETDSVVAIIIWYLKW